MATVKICDKCGCQRTFSKFVFSHDEKHQRGNEEYEVRKKTTYDLCDKCAMEIALQIDEFADALILDCSEDE